MARRPASRRGRWRHLEARSSLHRSGPRFRRRRTRPRPAGGSPAWRGPSPPRPSRSYAARRTSRAAARRRRKVESTASSNRPRGCRRTPRGLTWTQYINSVAEGRRAGFTIEGEGHVCNATYLPTTTRLALSHGLVVATPRSVCARFPQPDPATKTSRASRWIGRRVTRHSAMLRRGREVRARRSSEVDFVALRGAGEVGLPPANTTRASHTRVAARGVKTTARAAPSPRGDSAPPLPAPRARPSSRRDRAKRRVGEAGRRRRASPAFGSAPRCGPRQDRRRRARPRSRRACGARSSPPQTR